MEALLTPEELSNVLSVPVATLAAWRSRGTGPKPLRVGKHVRYRKADVVSWLNRQARARSIDE